jgi:hypothetical protein
MYKLSIMKLIKYFTLFFLAAIILVSESCNKFKDINVDPINATSIDPLKQLIYAQMIFSGDRSNYLRSASGIIYPLLQQMSGTFTNNSGATYAYSQSIYSTQWTEDYTKLVVNIVDAVENSRKNTNRPNLYAMCRIMKVLAFSRLTDLYGDIPYSEAGKGFIALNTQPKFDKQEDIYNDFLKELKESYQLLDASKDQVTTEQYFQGDIQKWKRFANSLRLRLAMRLIKIDPEKARTEVQSAAADGVMQSNSDICLVKHENVVSSGTEFRGNGLSTAVTAAIFRINTTFLNLLKPSNLTDPVDPRLFGYTRSYYSLPAGAGLKMYDRPDITRQVEALYAATPGNNAYSGVVGLEPGNTSVVNVPMLSAVSINVPGVGVKSIPQQDQRRQIANYLTYLNAPFLVMTYSEVSLLLAEAKVRGWDVGTSSAQTFYQNGILASIDQLKFFTDAPVFTGVNEFVQSKKLLPGEELKAINIELHLSLFLNPHEAFANWRRSGFPQLVATGTPVGRPIPRRFQYPLNEEQQNNASFKDAISRINGAAGVGNDSFLNHVWWDK